jgi:hypothetical protein
VQKDLVRRLADRWMQEPGWVRHVEGVSGNGRPKMGYHSLWLYFTMADKLLA